MTFPGEFYLKKKKKSTAMFGPFVPEATEFSLSFSIQGGNVSAD